jgi:Slime mold cyclic AMP receptor
MRVDENLSSNEEFTLRVIVSVSGTLSILACLGIISSYIYFREYYVFHLRLILLMSCIDLFVAIMMVVGVNTRPSFIGTSTRDVQCEVEAGLLQFGCLAGLLWTACLAHTFLKVLGDKDDAVHRFEAAYHVITWGFCTTSVLVLALANAFGDAGLWCWIQGRGDNELFRFAFFYVPGLVVLLWNVGCYWRAARQLRHEGRSSSTAVLQSSGGAGVTQRRRKNARIVNSFRQFVLVYVLVWLFGFANRVQHLAKPREPVFWLYCCQAIVEPSVGLLNALVYGLNDDLVDRLAQLTRSIGARMPAPLRYVLCCECIVPRSAMEARETPRRRRRLQRKRRHRAAAGSAPLPTAAAADVTSPSTTSSASANDERQSWLSFGYGSTRPTSSAAHHSNVGDEEPPPIGDEQARLMNRTRDKDKDDWYQSFMSEYDEPPSPTRSRQSFAFDPTVSAIASSVEHSYMSPSSHLDLSDSSSIN